MDNIHEIFGEIECLNVGAVLTTIIKVEGSAYRKEGTTMLFTEDKRQVGVISGGCLETDLEHQAHELLENHSRQWVTIVYDLSSEDDLSWGRGAGCNGKVHILLEKVTSELKSNLLTVKQHLSKGIQVVSFTILNENRQMQKRLFITDNGKSFGSEQIPSDPIIHSAFKDGSHIYYSDELKQNVYIHHFKPKPRLFIIGAGLDVRPFAKLASLAGFLINIWDWRATYCDKQHFPEATLMKVFDFTEAFEEITFMPSDSVVIMTHDFQKDKKILKYFLGNQIIGYLGILGPRKRTSRLLDGCEIPANLHSPIGLPIKAEGPEEIAVSIIAELIESQRSQS